MWLCGWFCVLYLANTPSIGISAHRRILEWSTRNWVSFVDLCSSLRGWRISNVECLLYGRGIRLILCYRHRNICLSILLYFRNYPTSELRRRERQSKGSRDHQGVLHDALRSDGVIIQQRKCDKSMQFWFFAGKLISSWPTLISLDCSTWPFRLLSTVCCSTHNRSLATISCLSWWSWKCCFKLLRSVSLVRF